MADVVDAETRSRMMSAIRGRDTKIEIAIRKALFSQGYRYRINRRDLPGRPDIVLPKHRAVVLVHGCFWHLHGCRLSKLPATRPEFWREKLERNRERDSETFDRLRKLGWRVATVWECSLRNNGKTGIVEVAAGLDLWLRGTDEIVEFGG